MKKLYDLMVAQMIDLNGVTADEAHEAMYQHYRDEVGEGEGLAEWQIEILLQRDVNNGDLVIA